MIEVRPMRRDQLGATAQVFAEAFVDDPGWTDVGPDDRARRSAYVRRICRGELRVAERVGGTVLITSDDGLPSAAIVWFPATGLRGTWRLTAAQVPGAVLSGPAALSRALRTQAAMAGGHPPEPHLHVSLLAARPSHQRSGLGGALLERALAEARRTDVPAYLDTANPANLPYYHRFGFRPRGEARLPRGAPIWFLLRPAAAG